MEKAGLGARFEAAQARRPLPPSPAAPQLAGTLLERVSDKVCGALGVECFVESAVLFLDPSADGSKNFTTVRS